MKKLSIIIPALNEAAGIAAALAALAPFRVRGVELIVAYGGSHDDTAALAAPLCDRVVASARGRGAQMNAGAVAATGDVLLFLHVDTGLPPDADGLIAMALEAHRCAWGRFDVRIAGRHPLLPMVAASMNLRSRLTGICTGDQAIFVIREAFTAADGFPDIALMEDIAISKRLKRIARPVVLAKSVTTSGKRWDEHGLWRTILLMWRLRLAYVFGAPPERLARIYGYAPR